MSVFRERLIPPDEVRRIVKRASELAMVGVEPADGVPLTEAELTHQLAELGIPREIAARAMAPAITPSAASQVARVNRIEREVIVDGMIPPDRHEEIADAINDAMRARGRVSVVGNRLTWMPGAPMLAEPAITVGSKDGRTRIHYVETLASPAQRTAGVATLALFSGVTTTTIGVGAMIAIAKAAAISSAQGAPFVLGAGLVLGIASAVASAAGLRRVLAKRAESRAAAADEVMARVELAARRVITAGRPRARVESPAHAALSAEDGGGEREELDASLAEVDGSRAAARRSR